MTTTPSYPSPPSYELDSLVGVELKKSLSVYRVLFSYGMNGIVFLLAALALLPLLAILFEILRQGIPVFKLEMLYSLPAAPGQTDIPNGFGNAILGTAMMVAFGALISIPIGVMTAVYLSEFGKSSAMANSVRFITTVMSGVPSIVVGVFVYGVVVLANCGGAEYKPCGFSGFAGAIALAVIMLPVITLSTEEALKLVPSSQRLGSAALGGNSFQTAFRIVISSAIPGITTGILLAVARAAGETAPLLFTAQFNVFWPKGLQDLTPSLPVLIYKYYEDPAPERSQLLWAASLVLIAMALLINILSRYFTRQRLKVR